MSHRLSPTIEHVWVALLLATVVATAGLLPLAPWDFWWHAAVGREIVTTGAIPATDHFSYTATGRPYHYQSWLSEIILYAALAAGGPAGAIWLRVGVLLFICGVLLSLSAEASRGTLRLAAAVTGAGVAGTVTNWAVRPQLLSLPLFAVELALLWRWRGAVTGPRPIATPPPLWPLPLLLALWANLHGAFVLGLGLPGLLWLGELLQQQRLTPPLRRLALWTGLATVAVAFNPRGLGIVGYVWTLLTDAPSQTFIVEWRPPTLATLEGRLFFTALAASAGLFVWQRRAFRISDWLWFGAFAFLASRGIRYVIWFFLLLPPLLALALAAARKSGTGPPQLGTPKGSVVAVNAALISAFALLALLATPPFKAHLPLPPALRGLATSDTPVAAVDILARRPPRHLFHDMGYGSYLIWRWRGSPPVFIDPRVELYPFALWQDYATVVAADPGWQTVLDRWQVDTLLLDRRREAPLIAAAGAAGWHERWHNAQTIIFDRERPQ